jgi:hypothetical protein
MPDRINRNSFQFSFVTKIHNTIDNNQPIYDSKVEKVFAFKGQRPQEFEAQFNFFYAV